MWQDVIIFIIETQKPRKYGHTSCIQHSPTSYTTTTHKFNGRSSININETVGPIWLCVTRHKYNNYDNKT